MTRNDASTTSTTTDNTADSTTDIIPVGTTVSGDVRYGAGLWQEYWNGVGNGADGFSSTEARLARLVAAPTTGQPLELASLTWMGSWSSQVWRVLCEWGTDGRLTAAERS